jgi:hypothetical protein
MGQIHVWKYICTVVRDSSSVLLRNRKTELSTAVDKCAYPENLTSGMGPMGHRNAILHNSDNLVTQTEAVMIASRVQMELETGIQGLLQGDRYLFDDHRVTKSAKWTVDSQVSWLDTVAEARQAYTVSLTRLRGLLEGRSEE